MKNAEQIEVLNGDARTQALMELKAEGKLFVSVMDADHGDRADTMELADAFATIQEEMAAGKWLRVIRTDGQSEVLTNVNDPRIANEEAAGRYFEDALEMGVQLGVMGG